MDINSITPKDMKDSLESPTKVDLLAPHGSYLTQLSQFDNWPVVRKPKYNVGDRVIAKYEDEQIEGVILGVDVYVGFMGTYICDSTYHIGEYDTKKSRWSVTDGWTDDSIVSVIEYAS